MNNYLRSTCLTISGLCLWQPAQAATVTIEWQNPGEYRDIRAGNEGQHDFELAYELRDAEGGVIASGAENIKDMGYRFSGMTFINDPPFNYENRLIHDWIARSFD